MLILSDFQSLTPNILAKTIETVCGGGIIVIMLKTMNSLKQLYQLTMDAHKKYVTREDQILIARFNERFILSLTDCENCIFLDDELNILPLILRGNQIKKMKYFDKNKEQKELEKLKDKLKKTEIISDLIRCTLTLDQAKCVLTFIESIVDKTLKSTISLTSGRGRGKSAALGISIAGAIAYGYSNIFVTAPSPENLKTVFEMFLISLNILGFQEYTHYTIVQSTNPNFNKAIIRVNIFRNHRQIIQYIRPQVLSYNILIYDISCK
jgi:N-acetyltransferase 10